MEAFFLVVAVSCVGTAVLVGALTVWGLFS